MMRHPDGYDVTENYHSDLRLPDELNGKKQ